MTAIAQFSQGETTLSFEDYLNYDNGTDNRYEWVEGALIAMPPESGENALIASALRFYLVSAGLIKLALIQQSICEVEVPLLEPGQARNRFPDLVILRPEHLELTRKRLTIRLDMPPPVLVVEVVSPGLANRQRDYQDKRAQYQGRGIPEYWLVDPEQETVTVLTLVEGEYQARVFQRSQAIISPTFPTLTRTAEQILHPQEAVL